MSQDRMKTPTSVPSTPFGVAEALRRASTAPVARPARRTLAEMAPGFERQPVLRLVPAVERSEVDAARAAVRRLTAYVDSARFRSGSWEVQAAALDNLRFEEARLAKLLADAAAPVGGFPTERLSPLGLAALERLERAFASGSASAAKDVA